MLDELRVERVIADDYDQEEFLRQAQLEPGKRCGYCYRGRLGRTALEADKLGFGIYTTTLTISPWQDHELIQSTGELLNAANDVQYSYFDFRPQYKFARTQTFALGLYRQKYCGCLLSQEESLQEKKDRDAVPTPHIDDIRRASWRCWAGHFTWWTNAASALPPG